MKHTSRAHLAALYRVLAAPRSNPLLRMSHEDRASLDRLEQAREVVCEALHLLEEAQRVLFRAGDCYVTEVWGDGVRAVIEITERITTISGDLTRIPIEIDRLAARDRDREA